MDRQQIVARLTENEQVLRARVRGDNRPDSDTDIMIEIDPAAPVGVIDRDGLKPYIRPAATADAIFAF